MKQSTADGLVRKALKAQGPKRRAHLAKLVAAAERGDKAAGETVNRLAAMTEGVIQSADRPRIVRPGRP